MKCRNKRWVLRKAKRPFTREKKTQKKTDADNISRALNKSFTA